MKHCKQVMFDVFLLCSFHFLCLIFGLLLFPYLVGVYVWESCLRYKHWLSASELQVQYKIDFPFSHHGKVRFSQKIEPEW